MLGGGIVPKKSEIKGNNAQERERERERQTDRQTDRERQRETETEREREGGREGRREGGRERRKEREGGREAFLTSVLFLASVLNLKLIKDSALRQLSTDPIIVIPCSTTASL